MPEIVLSSKCPCLVTEARSECLTLAALPARVVSDPRAGSLPDHLEQGLQTNQCVPDARRCKALIKALTGWLAPGTLEKSNMAIVQPNSLH